MNNEANNKEAAAINKASLEEAAWRAEVLEELKKNSAASSEILQSVKFIRTYFKGQALYNTIKIVAIVLVIVLGIISWQSIVNNLLKVYG